jgi:PAS domain S-box-containing protein
MSMDKPKPEAEQENLPIESEAILSALSEGISIQDRNFRIIYQNRAHIKVRGDHVGEYCFKAYVNDEQICEVCPVKLTFEDGKPHIVEKTRPTTSGVQHIEISSSPLTESGSVVACIEVIRDITERKRTEDELKNYPERLEQLVREKTQILESKISELRKTESKLRNSERILAEAQKIAGIGSWEWEIATGKTNWSDELYRIYGFEPHEITPDYDLVVETMHPKSREAFLGAIDAALKGGRSLNLDYSFVRKDGSSAVLHTVGEIIYGSNGKPERMIGFVQDITERKKAESEILERARHAALGADVGSSLTKGATSREMLQGCAEAMVRHLDAALARIWTFNSDEQMLELQASAGLYTHLDGNHSRVPLGKFKIGLIALKRKPVITNAVIGDPNLHDQEWALREGIVSFAGYPLTIGNRLVGVMALFSRNTLSDTKLDSLASVADVISVGIKRRKAEKDLKLFSLAVEEAGDGIHLVDLEGKIFYANQANEWIYGYSPGDLIGKNVSTLSADPEYDHMSTLATIREKGRWDGEVMVKNKNGRRFPIWLTATLVKNDAGTPIAVLGIFRDITERKRYKEKIENLNARLQTLIQSMPDMVVFKDKVGRHLIVNKAVEELTGLSQDKIIGKTETDILPPEFAEACRRSDEEVMRNLVPMRFEEISRKEDGQKMYFETIKAPIFDNDNKIAGLVAVSRDITARRLAEEKEKKLNRDLKAQINKLETAYKDMESFSYTASHDLKQPLMIISWFARNLSKVYADKLDDKGMEDLGIITENVHIMERLINDLLAFSKVSTKKLNMCEINVRSLVEKVYDELRKPLGEREIKLQIKTLPDVYGDLPMIQLLFTNLLSNAIKYSRTERISQIEIGSVPKKNENVYYVTDNGVGFDMAHADMLFGLFHRLHSSSEFEGTGVGLGIAKRIVEKHKGRIWAEAKLNKGATFFFSLPKGKKGIHSSNQSEKDLVF